MRRASLKRRWRRHKAAFRAWAGHRPIAWIARHLSDASARCRRHDEQFIRLDPMRTGQGALATRGKIRRIGSGGSEAIAKQSLEVYVAEKSETRSVEERRVRWE